MQLTNISEQEFDTILDGLHTASKVLYACAEREDSRNKMLTITTRAGQMTALLEKLKGARGRYYNETALSAMAPKTEEV
jgi:hypothetical protein